MDDPTAPGHMSDPRSLDAIAILGCVVTFLGLWAIWPPIAVTAAGVMIVAIAVALAAIRLRGGGRTDE